MRLKLVVMSKPARQCGHHGAGIWTGTDTGIIALDRAHEGLSHAIRLRALQRCGTRLQSSLPSKRLGRPRHVAALAVNQLLDHVRQPVHRPEAMPDCAEHQIADILALDPLCGGDIAQRLAVTTIKGKGHPHLLAIVTIELKSVRARSEIAVRDRDAPVVLACPDAARMPLEPQAVHLHHAINPLVVGRDPGPAHALGAPERHAPADSRRWAWWQSQP